MTKVLFVDDEPNVLAGLRRMLRGYRRVWDMAFCQSGAEALSRLRADPCDVVVTDMRMPGMDGAELLDRVRAGWPETARIVLSGHSDQEMTLRSVGPAHHYLAKPCDPDALRSAIERVASLQRRTSGAAVREIVASVDGLPTIPEIYVELVEELVSPEACVERVGQIVSRDLGIASKILQLVNSSFFGLPVHVENVSHAVALLGLGVVKPLVLSTGVVRHYERRDLGGLSLARLVDHSTAAAILARDIAASESAAGETADHAFLAGVLHDVGRLVLAEARPNDYTRLAEEAAAGGDPVRLERLAFGATHADVGGHLLGLWGLPAPVVEAVASHHTPSTLDQDAFSPATALHAAEALLEPRVEWDLEHLERVGVTARTEAWARLAPAEAEGSPPRFTHA